MNFLPITIVILLLILIVGAKIKITIKKPAGEFCFAIARRCFKLRRIKVQIMRFKWFTIATALGAFVFNAAAWDYEGHHAVNELALASLPTNFPAFVLTPDDARHASPTSRARPTAGAMKPARETAPALRSATRADRIIIWIWKTSSFTT